MDKKYLFVFLLCSLLFGCESNSIVDSNEIVAGNKWLYTSPAKATFEITDTTKTYDISFKLRINTEYSYSNLFVLTTLKDSVQLKKMRHQVQIAKSDGEWLGKGSGDLYTYIFPVFKNYSFAKSGKYTVEIEQNMRENPLNGVSDIGILVSKN